MTRYMTNKLVGLLDRKKTHTFIFDDNKVELCNRDSASTVNTGKQRHIYAFCTKYTVDSGIC